MVSKQHHLNKSDGLFYSSTHSTKVLCAILRITARIGKHFLKDTAERVGLVWRLR